MARLMRSVDRGLLWRYLGFTATEDGRGCGANALLWQIQKMAERFWSNVD